MLDELSIVITTPTCWTTPMTVWIGLSSTPTFAWDNLQAASVPGGDS